MNTNLSQPRAAQASSWPSSKLRRLKVWVRNLRHWKTARAYRDLTRAMRRDPNFANSWQCNIAMSIYDGAKSKLTIIEANGIADKMMGHLFSIDTTTFWSSSTPPRRR